VTVRVAELAAPRQIRLTEAPMPVVGPHDVLVRVRAVGICGSDLHYYAEGRIGEQRLVPGHILGHEVAGVVEAVGPEVEDLRPGTAVAVDPAIHCGRCRHCAAGNPNFCVRLRFFGSPPTPGALREYLSHPGHLVTPLPEAMSLAEGAALEPLGVAVHAVDLGHLAVGDVVAVFGCGPIGLLIGRMAQLAGARAVWLTEVLPHRAAAAAGLGLPVALDASREDLVRRLMEGTGGEGVDVAFEAAGSETATAQALEVLRPGGTLVLVGYWRTERLTLAGIRAMRKGLTVRFVRRMKNTFPRAVALARDGHVKLSALITHEFPLERVAEAFARAEQRAPDVIKAIVSL
jgi:L-iditol 2-dehydrogenase